jgi:hypothetical protein
MVVMFQVKVFWVVTLCSVVVGYQCFRGPCYLHLQGEVAIMGENGTDRGPDWRGVAPVPGVQEERAAMTTGKISARYDDFPGLFEVRNTSSSFRLSNWIKYHCIYSS